LEATSTKGREQKMTEVLRLRCSDGPDVVMILTNNNAYDVDVQRDEKGEFIILPNSLKPKRKQRKIYLTKEFGGGEP